MAVTLNSNSITIDGNEITASASELNKLDGAVVSTAELNRLDGLSSNLQSQLNTASSNASNAGGDIFGTSDYNLQGGINFLQSNAPHGYQQRWGTYDGGSIISFVYFDFVFSNQCFQVGACTRRNNPGNENVMVDSLSTNRFRIYANSGERPANYFAIGI